MFHVEHHKSVYILRSLSIDTIKWDITESKSSTWNITKS